MAKWGEIKCPRCEMLEEHLCLTEERLKAAQRDAKEAEAYAEALEAERDALTKENERLRGNVQTMIHAFFAAREGELSAAMHLCVAEVIAANPPPCNDGE